MPDPTAITFKEHFVEYVLGRFYELADLFKAKNKQYATQDPLANFRTSALMNQHNDSYAAMYKEARNACSKHIAHVVNNDIDGNKVDESLKDIAVYMMIMLFMRHENERLQNHECSKS